MYYFFLALVFLATLLGVEALSYVWKKHYSSESRRIKKRIDQIQNNDIARINIQSILKSRYDIGHNEFIRALYRLSFTEHIEGVLLQSGVTWSMVDLLKKGLFSAFTGMLVAFFANFSLQSILILTMIGLSVPMLYLYIQKSKRMAKFEEQLPEVIDSMTRSLRVGNSVTATLTMIGSEFQDPIGTEFRILMQEHNLGVNLTTAFQNLVVRVPLTDVKFFVIALLIQRETGGNLSDVLSNISTLMRERFTLKRQINVLTSEGRSSAKVLAIMPFLLIVLMSQINADYSRLMFGPEGIFYLKIGAVAMIIGVLWMRSITNIKM